MIENMSFCDMSDEQINKTVHKIIGEMLETLHDQIVLNHIPSDERVNFALNCLVNLCGNALFSLTPGDQGYKPFKRNSDKFLGHLHEWFENALLIKFNELNNKDAKQ